MEYTIIYLTRMPILSSFKPVRRMELLRSGVYNSVNFYLETPTWEGGDLYPIDDANWDKYLDCIKNNIHFKWKSIDS
jgi:hypothetical protein